MNFESTGKATEKELESLLAEELTRRDVAKKAATAGAAVLPYTGSSAIHKSLLNTLYGEFDEIRKNPELKAKNMDQMVRTYEKYLQQGNNPVEIFVPNNQNKWAAGRLKDGNDVVFYDPSAPHPAVMAHELGHVQMFESNDPLSYLQNSGVGRASGNLAPILGIGGAAAGYNLSRQNRLAGAALGTALGAVGSSGNFAYELGGASGRAMGYLPEDVDQQDAYGDLLRAGMTYGMGGPGVAIASGSGLVAAIELAKRLNRR